MKRFSSLFVVLPLALCLNVAKAADEGFVLTLKDHQFTPSTLEIPAGQKVKLTIKNQDKTAEEFESSDLHREKVIPAGKDGVVNIGPLKPGTYSFKGEYNPKTATGTIVVK
ncbi:MAG: cupredoxin domain-containing protein [Formivibrio sp.]|nr:cupredoxin domain-containing protein [Formivibrio sp.]